ncbi:MAG: PAS domain S-box protein [Sphingobacteriaceae bacterium]|nr:PAS domain S-box protein [Sphingobacteriaceae bacterium]
MENSKPVYKTAVYLTSYFVSILGIAIMTAWFLDIRLLESVFPNYNSMKFNTALGFAILGISIILQRKENSIWLVVSKIFAGIVISIGAGSLYQDVFQLNIGIDQFFVKENHAVGIPGRMSPLTAICFCLTGGFLLLHTGNRYAKRISQILLHIVTIISFVAIVGYILNVPNFYKLSVLSAMAVHTALSFFIFSIGASLIHPEKGITGLFTGSEIGNIMARKLFAQVILSMLILTYFRIETERQKWVSVEFGIALFAISFLLVMLFLIWKTSGYLNRIDAKKSQAESSLSQVTAFLNSTPEPIIILDSNGYIQLINDKAELVFGYKKEDLTGKTFVVLLPHQSTDHSQFSNLNYNHIHIPKGELFMKKMSGELLPVDVSVSPFKVSGEEYTSVAIKDISERKKAEMELKESNLRNQIFVKQSPNALAMVDKEMRYVAASEKWYKDYKLEGKEIIGKSHYDIFPEIGEDWKKIHNDCLQGDINTCDEASFEREDGSLQWISWDVRPWYISEGNIGGLLMYTAEITSIKEKDIERKKIEYILERSNQIAKIATWEITLKNDQVSWSNMAKDIFELPESYNLNKHSFLEFFKKGESYDNLISEIEILTTTGKPYDLEIEITTAKQNQKWIRIIGEAEFKNKKCVRRFGVFQDITRSKKSGKRAQYTQ